MAGTLIFLCGILLLYSLWKFSGRIEHWSTNRIFVLRMLGVILTIWGIVQIVVVYRGRVTEAHLLPLRRHRVMLPREGVVCLIMMIMIFLGAAIDNANMLLLVFALLAGPFVLNGWITFWMLRGVRVERHLPQRSVAGDPVAVNITVENRRRWFSSWLMIVRDQIRSNTEQLSVDTALLRVPAKSKSVATYRFLPMRRGVYQFGPLQISSRFPFGLIERGIVLRGPGQLRVAPRIGKLTPSWKREDRIASELVPRKKMRAGVFDDEFHSLREYRWGDNPRAIHWPTSARRSQVMVREFHQSRDQNLIVLIDLHSPAAGRTDEQAERIELAVSFAATVCVEHMRQSRDSIMAVGVLGTSFSSWVGDARPSGIGAMLDSLAAVQGGAGQEVDALVEFARKHRTPATRVLLVTTRPTSGAAGTPATASTQQQSNVLEVARAAGWQVIAAEPAVLSRFFALA